MTVGSLTFRILAVVLLCAPLVFGQQAEIDQAVELFNKKDYASSSTLLREITKRDKTNTTAWLYLARSYEGLDKKDDAGKTYYRVFETGSEHFRDSLSKQLEAKDVSAEKLFTFIKEQGDLLLMSVESAVKAEHNSKLSYDNEARLKANALYNLLKIAESGQAIFWNKDTDKKIKFVKNNYRPHEPDRRPPNVQRHDKTVQLLLVIDRSGKVVIALPTAKTQPWFDLQAMKRALALQYEPAQKDGKAVLTLVRLEYHLSPW